MVNKKKLFSALAGITLLGLALTGCTSDTPGKNIENPKPEPTLSTELPEPGETTTPEPTDEPTGAPAQPSGEGTAPGTVVSAGEWMTYDFRNFEDARALVEARIVSLKPADATQVDFLVNLSADLVDYDISIIRWEEKQKGGADLAFNASTSVFKIARADGTAGQELVVIGWDDCKTNAWPKDFHTGNVVVSQCTIGAVPKGSANGVGGLLFVGNYGDTDNPFDVYEGKPVFLKG